jgi:hypothetical protein
MGYERKWIDDHDEILDKEFSLVTIAILCIALCLSPFLIVSIL